MIQGLLCWPSVQPLIPVISWRISRTGMVGKVLREDGRSVSSGHYQAERGREAFERQIRENREKSATLLFFSM